MTQPSETMKVLVETALEEMKAKDVVCLDVRNISSFADYMLVATGTSNRHVRSLAGEIVKQIKQSGSVPVGVEGEGQGEWVLIDLGDVVVHIMQAETRVLYDLESLWAIGEARPE